jgi:hypothetical protein
LLSYDRLSKKPLLFKSFTGLTIKEFDDIYEREIVKRYGKHEIKRLSKRKNRKRAMGASRYFKRDVKNRFLMLLVYYRLYITYTLWLAFYLIWIKVTSAAGTYKRLKGWLENVCLSLKRYTA